MKVMMVETTIGLEAEGRTVLMALAHSTRLLRPKFPVDCSAGDTAEKLSMDIAGMVETQVFTEAAAEAEG